MHNDGSDVHHTHTHYIYIYICIYYIQAMIKLNLQTILLQSIRFGMVFYFTDTGLWNQNQFMILHFLNICIELF